MDFIGQNFTASFPQTSVMNPQIRVEGQLTDGGFILFGWVEFQGDDLQSTASVKENNLEDSFNIFSYNKNLSVETDEYKDYTLQVYNLSGRLVLDENTNGNFNTNISQSGIYIVKLRSEDGVLTKKIFIE
jgi:hypothetical protein